MSEAIKIPQSILFCPDDHDPGETIVLLTGEPGARGVVATVYNFYDFPCLEDDQAEEFHKAAVATADKMVRAYNSLEALIESLDPDALDAIAGEIGGFEHSARAHSLRVIASRQRASPRRAQRRPVGRLLSLLRIMPYPADLEHDGTVRIWTGMGGSVFVL